MKQLSHAVALAVLISAMTNCATVKADLCSSLGNSLQVAAGAGPDAAADQFGNVNIVWQDPTLGIVYAQVGSNGAVTVPAMSIYKSTGDGFPHIAVDNGGNSHIIATTGSFGGLLYLKVSGGKPVLTNAFFISPTLADDEYDLSPALAIDPTKDLPVVVAEVQTDVDEWEGIFYPVEVTVYSAFVSAMPLDAGGNPIRGSRFDAWYDLETATPNYNASYPSVAVDKNGAIHVVWLYQDSSLSGLTVGYSFSTSSDYFEIASTPNVNGLEGSPVIIRGYDGNLDIVWSGGNEVVWQQMTPQGAAISGNVVVSQPQAVARWPRLASANGQLICAWTDGRESTNSQIYARSLLDAVPECDVSDSPGAADLEAVAINSSGSPAYVWQDSRSGSSQLYCRTVSSSVSVSGQIASTCDGSPIAGALVQIGSYSGTSDTNGMYSITGLSPGTFTATIAAADYASISGTVILPASGKPVTQNFALVPVATGLMVNGRVLDGTTKQALGGANVSLGAQDTTTGPNGTFAFENASLTSGNALSVSLSGYLNASVPVVPPDCTSALTVPDVLLQPTPTNSQPTVTSLTPAFQPVFISSLPIADDFTATVNWNGSTPGTVQFYANRQIINTLNGAGPAYTVTLDPSYFNPSLAPGGNTVSVVANNSEGMASMPASVMVFDVPYPPLLALVFPPSGFQTGPVPLTIAMSATWPIPAISTPVLNLPVVGAFGVSLQLNPHFQYDFGNAEWDLGLGNVSEQQNSAETDPDFTLLFGSKLIDGNLTLGGSGNVSPVSGFTDTQIHVGFQMAGEFTLAEIGALDLFGPGISSILLKIPVIGGLVDTLSLKVVAEPEIGGDFNLNFPEFQPQSVLFGGSCALNAEYEPSLGKDVKLKAYVGGKPSLDFQIPSQPPGGFLNKAAFEAYAGIEADAWSFKYSAEYVFLDLHYPPSPSPNSIRQPKPANHWVEAESQAGDWPQIVARPNLRSGREVFVNGPAQVHANQAQASPASALENFRAMGHVPGPGSQGVPRPDGAGPSAGSMAQADLTLVTNAYPNNDPALASFGQELMLLYVSDNENTNNLNFTEINWTRFDGTNWSAPLTIGTNVLAGFDPQVKCDGNSNAIAVWERVNDPNFNQTNLTAMAADMEISWSQWNRTARTWSTPVALTSNNYLDHAPLLCGPMSDGSLLVTWTANTSNLLMGTNGAASQVLWSQWSPASQTWSTPQTLVSNLTYELSGSLSGASNLAVYAWSLDTVGTLTNLPDDQVFYCLWSNGVWGAASAFPANALGNRNAHVAVSPGMSVDWVWQQGSNLVMSTNFSLDQTLVRSNSQTAGFLDFAMTLGPSDNLFILWQDMTTNGCHAHYIVYDPVSGKWSQDEVLRNDPPLERSFAPVWDNAGDLTIAYDVVHQFFTNITMSLTNGTVVTITNVPQPGQVDIAVTKRALIKDLALLPGDFSASATSFFPGAAVMLTANVRNLGDLAISNVVVSFYDGDPNSSGVLISNVALPGWLPGAVTNGLATALWVVPPPATNYVLYAVVDQTNASTEFNPSNNTQSLSVGGTDLAVSFLSYNALTNGSVRVIAQVQNLGAPAAPSSILAIRSNGQTGTPLAANAIPALGPGRLAQVALDLPPGAQPAGVAVYQLFADDTHVVADVNTNNNITAFSVFLWIDSDGDGIPDSWMMQYFGHPTGLASDNTLAQDSYSGDGISNLQKYLTGMNPLIWDNLHFVSARYMSDRTCDLTTFAQVGHDYSLLASTNLATWTPILKFTCTNGTMDIFDIDAGSFDARFYQLVTPPTGP